MAKSTKRNRRSKHRGTQGGTVKQSGRGRSRRAPATRMTAEQRRLERMNRPPSWTRSLMMGGVTAAFLLFAFMVLFKRDAGESLQFALVAIALYVPAFYFIDSLKYRRHQQRQKQQREQSKGDS